MQDEPKLVSLNSDITGDDETVEKGIIM
jgi:hypothetical protein